jgi:hypothetical protein
VIGPEAWLTWRAGLPPAAGWADISALRGPAKRNMRSVLAAVQGNRCARCLADGLRLVLDHDHGTGLARGMLCTPCNNQAGQHESGLFRTWCEITALYLADPPAAASGWIWDTCGSAWQLMFVEAGAQGRSIPSRAPADVIDRAPAAARYLDDLFMSRAQAALAAIDRTPPEPEPVVIQEAPPMPPQRRRSWRHLPPVTEAEAAAALQHLDLPPL